jgi:hypothetical protein
MVQNFDHPTTNHDWQFRQQHGGRPQNQGLILLTYLFNSHLNSADEGVHLRWWLRLAVLKNIVKGVHPSLFALLIPGLSKLAFISLNPNMKRGKHGMNYLRCRAQT